ncbi:TetR/AcrR family transcriptional regulator [Kribbella sp. NPDC004536]|uniref:TetR/AcrR family transcriptional regulator n=1 Tax=Kribbella sp. NPDC004536 TaxID=3364106 RepID=UPI0036A94435
MTSDPTPRNSRSTTRFDLVEGRIIMEATRLFAERGFAGTSLKDIAEATGLTRPALYHYVRSKEDILAKLVTELAELPAQALRAVNAEKKLTPPQRLRQMAFAVALLQATGPAKFQLLIRSEADLPPDLVKRYAESRRKVLREFVGVIDAGIAAGVFRAVDPRIAALSIIGQCNWVAWWHHDGTPEENERVADQLADLAVASVLAADDVHAEDNPRRRALARLRRELDYLEQVIDD